MKATYKNQTVTILELYETDNAHIALPNGDIELVPTSSLKVYPNPTETRLIDNFGGINEPE